jgi:ABC-type glycerol-3-phosphate transport system permease component
MRVRVDLAIRAVAGGLFVGLLAPVAWLVLGSLTPEARIFQAFEFPPSVVTDHYRAVFALSDFWVAIRNSMIVAGATTAIALPVSACAAYALARLRFSGKSVLLALVLSISMFPQVALVSPLFILLRALGLINTYPGLVLPYLTFAMPLSIWLLVGFFRQLPVELEEAALLDGASRVRVLVDVVVPLAAPALATTAILTFLYCWNEFLFALSFTLGPERYTVPVAITLFRGRYQIAWGEVLAAAVLATMPAVAVVMAFQRRIVQGLTAGAIKG